MRSSIDFLTLGQDASILSRLCYENSNKNLIPSARIITRPSHVCPSTYSSANSNSGLKRKHSLAIRYLVRKGIAAPC